jgi:two-component system cell cycle sensor histidine kinase/response regulator CckA
LASSAVCIHGDVGQIQQVVMNLIINAGEAMGANAGRISVRTSHMDLALNDTAFWKFTAAPLPPGRYALLQVTDTGCGMSQETLNRIFDPFYTTKFAGRGLGLAAVLGVIRGHHGGVSISTEVGKGTTFDVVFPMAKVSAAAEVTEMKGMLPLDGTGVTVLVIDDEPSVQELLTDIFFEAKFTVIGASNPREGIELYREHRNAIAIVILDYSMPDMDGKAAFEELVRINPEVEVLLCSGYSEEEMASAFGDLHPAGFIHKPYQPNVLLERVRRIISVKKGTHREG